MIQKNNWAFFSGVFLVCACVMALQILQSRIFSVVTWYHLSFLVISIAMFGLTLGALKVYAGNELDQRQNLPAHLRANSFWFGVITLLSLIVQIAIPIISTDFKTLLVTLPFVAGVTAAAYYYAGQLISLCLTRSDKPVGLVYGADLIGASAGCLGALALMQTIDGPSAVLVISGLAILSGYLFTLGDTRQTRRHGIIGLLIILCGLLNASLAKPLIYPLWTKGALLTEKHINFEKWNSISRVTVINQLEGHPVFLWGASPLLPKNTTAEYQYLMIDGDASTPITKFDGVSWSKLKYLEYDVTNIPYFMPGINSVAVIGVGGGRDLLSARYFGAKKTIAMDVNATQVNLLTKNQEYSNYANLNKLPNSKIINSEARNFFSRNNEKFDVIQMSLIDTWAATGAGAFALSENSIYTVDAFKIFMNSLNPHGALSVSRWQKDDSYNEIGRMISMTMAALQDRGVKDPWKNIIVVRSARIATMVASPEALTTAQLTAIEKASTKYKYEILISPRTPSRFAALNAIYKSADRAALLKATQDETYDISPPSDMRPFFFNQAKVMKPLQIIKAAYLEKSSAVSDTMQGHLNATLNLYIIILFSVIAATLTLILPFRGALADAPSKFVRAGSAYFAMIGLGFMFVEISLMQIMTTFLGHPVYSLGIVLFSLILSSGFGSMLSERHPLRTRHGIMVWTGLIFVYIATMAVIIDPMTKLFIEQPFIIRTLITIGLIMPCGLLLGYAFPTGMRLTQSVAPKMTAWFWGINGACGVVASALAVLVGIGWGLDITLLIGACFYGLLTIPALTLLKFSNA
ncbi:MAG: hypothetical protein JWO78_1899 [Micavibrio sp.]|nr:hypothetical protein [Micavibrio sp.]